MGTYAETKGFAVFKTVEDKTKALEAWNKWNAENSDEENDNSVKVETQADERLILSFAASSGRDLNLAWRIEQILELIKPFGLSEFDAPVLIESELGVYWNEEDEED